MIRRLGARRWTRLHRLVYLTGVLAALHFIWLAKVGRTDQYVYAAVLAGSRGRCMAHVVCWSSAVMMSVSRP